MPGSSRQLQPEVDSQLDSLLQQSLGQARPHEPLYSVRANFFVAFFGGVYATLIFSFLNSRRLGRTRDDAALYLLLAAAWTAAVVVVAHLHAAGQLPPWLDPTGGAREMRFAAR